MIQEANRFYAITTLLNETMRKAGGRLAALDPQNLQHIRDNNYEGETTIPTNEGTNIMNASNNAVAETVHSNQEVPPAGGYHEQAQGAQQAMSIGEFLSAMGVKETPKPSSWQDHVIENAVPLARTIAGVLIAQGVVYLVQRQVAKRREAKQLAAAAEASTVIDAG